MIELTGYSMCDYCCAIVPDSKMDHHEYFHRTLENLSDKVWGFSEY